MVSYQISGMTCNGCLNKVRSTLEKLSSEVIVTLEPPLVKFNGEQHPNLGAVRAALSTAGKYTASEFIAPDAMFSGEVAKPGWLKTYYPLLLILSYIAIASLAGTGGGNFDAMAWMNHFMAGFFLVFSFFKLLDIRGFAASYASYDLLAARWTAYGFFYPFIELGLGLAYLFAWQPVLTNFATMIVMGFSSLGVINALRKRQVIRCACLGTVLNLPMSTVTLVEDIAMVAMAAFALVSLHG